MAMTLEEMEKRLRTLESWANREALQRGTFGFIAERIFAEHLSTLPPEDCDRILCDLANPYRFATTITGPRAADERLKRAVNEAASQRVEEAVESIRQKTAKLREARVARELRPDATASPAREGDGRD